MIVTADILDAWRRKLDEIRTGIERAQQSKDMQAETAWFDVLRDFEEFDSALEEAWIDAVRGTT